VRKVVHGACALGVAVAVAGCAFGTGTKTPVTADGARLSPASAPGPGRAPLGLVAIPRGATPASGDNNAPMDLASFIGLAYPAAGQAAEKSVYAKRGFVTAVIEGWTNSDRTKQSIVLVRFATGSGATSEFNDFTDTLGQQPGPVTMIADPADQAVGSVNRQPNAQGYDLVIMVDRVGDDLIEVFENSTATPNPAAAEALLLDQVKALKTHP
jgi:hypothetical protein